MKKETYTMTETEEKFADLVWEREPIGSGELVKVCNEELDWKKSTTYTVLRKLCENQILKNEEAVVSSVLSKSEYMQNRSSQFVEEHYEGSLPKFIAAFMGKKKLSRKQVDEIRSMISEYEENE